MTVTWASHTRSSEVLDEPSETSLLRRAPLDKPSIDKLKFSTHKSDDHRSSTSEVHLALTLVVSCHNSVAVPLQFDCSSVTVLLLFRCGSAGSRIRFGYSSVCSVAAYAATYAVRNPKDLRTARSHSTVGCSSTASIRPMTSDRSKTIYFLRQESGNEICKAKNHLTERSGWLERCAVGK